MLLVGIRLRHPAITVQLSDDLGYGYYFDASGHGILP